MTIERGNVIHKKKGGSEGGDQVLVRVRVRHMDQKRIEMMTNSKSKKPRFPWDQEFGCLESLDVNCSTWYQIYDHHHHYHHEEKEAEEEKGKEVGVFDFPWLKEEGEGVIFKGDHHEYLFQQGTGMGMGMGMGMEMGIGIGIQLDHPGEDTFALYSSCLPENDTTSNGTPSTTTSAALHHDHAHDLTSSSALKIPPIFHDNDNGQHPKLEDNNPRLNSFQVDHADIQTSIDQHATEYCIWSSVLDQPLDINLNIL